jgi:hypothetical protein
MFSVHLQRTSSRVLREPVVVVAVGAVLSTVGCYERVTRATGFGADQYTVSEPYQRNSAVDDWIFGKQQPSSKSGSRIPPTPQND